MKNYVQSGSSVTISAPATLQSGVGVLIGELFGVAGANAAIGNSVALYTDGIFDLPKEATADTFSIGDAVEWDTANERISAVDGGLKIGVVVRSASATDSTVRIRLV